MEQDKLRWPGSPATTETIVDSASMAPENAIWNDLTFLHIDDLAQDGTLTISKDDELRKGALLVIVCNDCGNKLVTLAGSVGDVPPFGGSDNIVETLILQYNGTVFEPAGDVSSFARVSLNTSGILAVTANAKHTYLSGTPSGAITLNVTAGAALRPGSMLHIKTTGSGTPTITLGTGIDGIAIANVDTKTKCQSFVWDGTIFNPVGAVQQID